VDVIILVEELEGGVLGDVEYVVRIQLLEVEEEEEEQGDAHRM
jgi:hypothetical protein